MFWNKQFSLRQLVKLVFAIYMIYEHTLLFTHAWLYCRLHTSLVSFPSCILNIYMY